VSLASLGKFDSEEAKFMCMRKCDWLLHDICYCACLSQNPLFGVTMLHACSACLCSLQGLWASYYHPGNPQHRYPGVYHVLVTWLMHNVACLLLANHLVHKTLEESWSVRSFALQLGSAVAQSSPVINQVLWACPLVPCWPVQILLDDAVDPVCIGN